MDFEIGYTPNNYKRLIAQTGLSVTDFAKQFDIPLPTLFHHQKGARTMKWRDWQDLLERVNNFKNNQKST